MSVQDEGKTIGELRTERGLYLALISVHGRIRGSDLELGSEPDTGGQTLYVVELARALARAPGVAQVDLFTRRIVDPAYSVDYAEPIEELAPGARIVRIDAGPEGFIRKEELWDHMDSFADNLLNFLRTRDLVPDAIHGHYADAGYVGLRVARRIGRPLVFTGHSLGRIKHRRLLADGVREAEIESRYHISRRIEAEEEALGAAELVVTSTRQELEEQYSHYEHYRPSAMRVMPPGLDMHRFHPSTAAAEGAHLERDLARFLRWPDRPLVLAIARPDERKNLRSLIRAFGGSARLRNAANLVIVAGNRDDIREREESVRNVVTGLLLEVDVHNLYGHVALPKHHRPDDIPRYYQLAARSGGVFVNPALTEPFGLTLLESAACGLPIVATEDGGPTEILSNCGNGVLVNPLDTAAIGDALFGLLSNPERWHELARNGIEGVRAHYSWKAHAETYLEALGELPAGIMPKVDADFARPEALEKRAVFTDIDRNLLGDADSIERLRGVLTQHRRTLAFGIATSRQMHKAMEFLREHRLPDPDVLITRLGTAIHYAPKLIADRAWTRHIDHLWNPRAIRRLLADAPGLTPQPREEQSVFKLSYRVDPDAAPAQEVIVRLLRKNGLSANVFLSYGEFLDIVPVRASKGAAIRYVADQWRIPLERILVAGGAGADEDMMRGNTLGVVVANRHQEELSQLVDADRIYFAERAFADGILEAIEHYDFLGSCRSPAP